MNRPMKTPARVIQLDTWRNARKRGAAVNATAERSGYRIAGRGFLIGSGVRNEVILSPTLYPVPNTPVWSRGLTNYRGNIVPVFDLGIFIGGADTQRDVHTVLILSSNGHAAGFLIDQPPQAVVAGTPVAARAPANTPALQPFLGAGLHANGTDWWEFDYHAFLLTLAGSFPGE